MTSNPDDTGRAAPLDERALPRLTAGYMDACMGKPADHNEIGLHYFMAGWVSGREAMDRASLPTEADKVDAELAIDNVLCSVLPGVYYMDPPDGGSVTPLEQVQRMAKDAARYRWLKETYTAANFDPASLDLGDKGVVLMFVAPDDMLVSSDLDEMIDDAARQTPGGGSE
ncbi:hypothetical protein [Variovorax sp. PAMC 28711]|uniref:hypothetical protein n=1 Tax=Variovorax sp. PAMC 28711 TaxID=1795631 RepID=UPI00078BFF0B|nr:hypothetical protein [Variovorax sp. PAMC 28711]AMM23204.1 hypothetical protein AX767_01540 [Variovorax sp. PAMC 28711]